MGSPVRDFVLLPISEYRAWRDLVPEAFTDEAGCTGQGKLYQEEANAWWQREIYIFGFLELPEHFREKPDLAVLWKQHAVDEDSPPTSFKMGYLWPYKSQVEVNLPVLGLRSKRKKPPEQGVPMPVVFADRVWLGNRGLGAAGRYIWWGQQAGDCRWARELSIFPLHCGSENP